MVLRRNASLKETGDPLENPPTSSIVRHDSHTKLWESPGRGMNPRFTSRGGEQSNRLVSYSTRSRLFVSPSRTRPSDTSVTIRQYTVLSFRARVPTVCAVYPAYGAAPKRKGGRNWRAPRKPADQRPPPRTILTCENPGVTRAGIEPGSRWWEASRLTAEPTWPRFGVVYSVVGERERNRFSCDISKSDITWYLQLTESAKSRGKRKYSLDVTHAYNLLLLRFHDHLRPTCNQELQSRSDKLGGKQLVCLSASKMTRKLKSEDKVDLKPVYTEVTFVIESEFIRHTLDDSAPIADLQGNKKRIPYCQMWGNTRTTANEQTSEVRLYKGLCSLAYSGERAKEQDESKRSRQQQPLDRSGWEGRKKEGARGGRNGVGAPAISPASTRRPEMPPATNNGVTQQPGLARPAAAADTRTFLMICIVAWMSRGEEWEGRGEKGKRGQPQCCNGVAHAQHVPRFLRSTSITEYSLISIEESEIQIHVISLVQHLYIGTRIKLDPGSELESFDLGSGEMLVQLLKYIPIYATTRDYLRLPATTCDYMRVLATTCDYLRQPATTCDYLQPLETTCEYLRLPATTCDYMRVLATTCD
ncbi:hypothetical protein PR048_025255 [Dryococelus australis]|uniref:Uncharacterized protein n=1 Tax=Dryococelus australis TaxID=614101 RepID=A0ABQ9GQV9_9NEOP|nr:hypothetical protein PR048_025255 [Dryococelus australis]